MHADMLTTALIPTLLNSVLTLDRKEQIFQKYALEKKKKERKKTKMITSYVFSVIPSPSEPTDRAILQNITGQMSASTHQSETTSPLPPKKEKVKKGKIELTSKDAPHRHTGSLQSSSSC